MQEITQAQFDAVLDSAKAENEIRVVLGLSPHAVTTKQYGSLTKGSGELIEYYFANTMFGFIQNGVCYSNGLG